jgi:hypothetical protein
MSKISIMDHFYNLRLGQDLPLVTIDWKQIEFWWPSQGLAANPSPEGYLAPEVLTGQGLGNFHVTDCQLKLSCAFKKHDLLLITLSKGRT